jgi:hypothetical protein
VPGRMMAAVITIPCVSGIWQGVVARIEACPRPQRACPRKPFLVKEARKSRRGSQRRGSTRESRGERHGARCRLQLPLLLLARPQRFVAR